MFRPPPFAVWPALALLGLGCGPGPTPGLVVSGLGRGVVPLAADEEIRPTVGQTLYVPVYSHVFTGDRSRPFNLAVTLSVRNTDPERPIVLTTVRYHDSDGKPIRDEMTGRLRLAPLAAAEFFVRESDTSGGSGASFLVEWVAEGPATPPVVESIMIGTASTQGISFVCPARVVKELRP